MMEVKQSPEQLKLLMDYTIFHIGLYLTVMGVVLAYVKTSYFKFERSEKIWVVAVTVCLAAAGLSGGVIAGNIPYSPDFQTFSQKWIGPYTYQTMPFEWWAGIEHTAFWVAVVLIVFGFLVFNWERTSS
jgi:uncharacterized membrane protein